MKNKYNVLSILPENDHKNKPKKLKNNMKCIYCENEVPDKANFCPNCKNQIKCLNCSENLEKDSEICIYCGEEKNNKAKSHNTIEFLESETTRSFKAHFSNEVGQSIGEALGIILMNKSRSQVESKNALTARIEGVNQDTDNVSDTEYSEIQATEIRKDKIFDVFKDNDNKITLLETRLKANSKRDYGIRLTLLFLYYKLLRGHDKVQRGDLTSIIRDASIEDGNYRQWLVKNNLVGVHDDFVELKAPGRERAKEILGEVYDSNKEDKWKLGTSKSTRKSKVKEENKNE